MLTTSFPLQKWPPEEMGNTESGGQDEEAHRAKHFLLESEEPGHYLALGLDGKLTVKRVDRGLRDSFLWRKDGKMLKNISGQVVDIEGGCREAGARVIVYPSHGGRNQQWEWEDGLIVSRLAGLVIQARDGEVMMAAKGGDGQRWKMEHQGEYIGFSYNQLRPSQLG